MIDASGSPRMGLAYDSGDTTVRAALFPLPVDLKMANDHQIAQGEEACPGLFVRNERDANDRGELILRALDPQTPADATVTLALASGLATAVKLYDGGVETALPITLTAADLAADKIYEIGGNDPGTINLKATLEEIGGQILAVHHFQIHCLKPVYHAFTYDDIEGGLVAEMADHKLLASFSQHWTRSIVQMLLGKPTWAPIGFTAGRGTASTLQSAYANCTMLATINRLREAVGLDGDVTRVQLLAEVLNHVDATLAGRNTWVAAMALPEGMPAPTGTVDVGSQIPNEQTPVSDTIHEHQLDLRANTDSNGAFWPNKWNDQVVDEGGPDENDERYDQKEAVLGCYVSGDYTGEVSITITESGALPTRKPGQSVKYCLQADNAQSLTFFRGTSGTDTLDLSPAMKEDTLGAGGIPQAFRIKPMAPGITNLSVWVEVDGQKAAVVETLKITVATLRAEWDSATPWDNWLPEGGPAEADGNTAEFSTDIKPSLPGYVVFELTDTTRFPGYCMNAPPQLDEEGLHSAAWPDLKIQNDNDSWATGWTILDDDGQTAHSNIISGETNNLSIRCYDYAASTKLSCKLKIPVDPKNNKYFYIAGKFVDNGKTVIGVPKDETDTGIADGWQIDGVAMDGEPMDDLDLPPGANDTADPDHDIPSGFPASNRGDGLTRFEEYRGFVTTIGHVRTSPEKMDVFIFRYFRDLDISLFQTALAPNVTVHLLANGGYLNKRSDDTTADFWNSPGAINFQTVPYRSGDQFCIKLIADPRFMVRDTLLRDFDQTDWIDASVAFPPYPAILYGMGGFAFIGPPKCAPISRGKYKAGLIGVRAQDIPENGMVQVSLSPSVANRSLCIRAQYLHANGLYGNVLWTDENHHPTVTNLSIDRETGVLTFTLDTTNKTFYGSVLISYLWAPSGNHYKYTHCHSRLDELFPTGRPDVTAHELGHCVSMPHHGGWGSEHADNSKGDRSCLMNYYRLNPDRFCTHRRKDPALPYGPDNLLPYGACLYRFNLKENTSP